MIGFLFLIIIGLWFCFVRFFVNFLFNKISNNWVNLIVRWTALLLIFPLPLMDEIFGKWQFEKLCHEHSRVWVDQETVRGRTVYLANPEHVKIDDSWVNINMAIWRFLDAKTNEQIVRYDRLSAEGGWISKISGVGPLLYKVSCEAGEDINISDFFEKLEITEIERKNVENFNQQFHEEEFK